jgi:N-acetylneuraminic acid mutarotase
MLEARSWLGLCVISGEVYVTGGISQQTGELFTVERYSPSSNTWSPVAPMPFAIYDRCACAIGDAMYVLDGAERGTLKYDSVSNLWSEVAPMPDTRTRFAACTVGNDIYIIGGYIHKDGSDEDDDDEGPAARVYKYSTDSDAWTTVTPLPSARVGLSACVLGGLIYVSGGDDNTLLRYDPGSDTWSNLAPMPDNRMKCALFSLGGCVYAAGGYSALVFLSYAYTPLFSYAHLHRRTHRPTCIAQRSPQRASHYCTGRGEGFGTSRPWTSMSLSSIAGPL